MREAVVELVEKVERSNDYSLWPHSRICMARPAELSKMHRLMSRTDLHADEDVYAYASAMIAALRVERDLERKAHSQTRRDTEYRITALEAQLARRDAELEACIYHTEHRAKIQSTDKKYRSNKTPSGGACSMTDEDIISVLEATAAKNRALELEVKQIAAQVRSFLFKVLSYSPSILKM
ncbi:hypothetical protein NEOLEDRAFT_1139747 [Neolentinus lepideus HHB14362 ss-1]|uniref:Uncharacterized protein n=1 Tax=Neolentinus lepideus HHB14362 ss-1 TaxID=1314782 RepID=A0A165PJL2_9AGAM|nr:hypothetical protein NEOLEDRAFT_1139747 [Neolentinus lepideus HHB14362 ss-1]